MFQPTNHRVIYALVDPRDSIVRYIGSATSPIKRYAEHLREAQKFKLRGKKSFKNKKDRWINELSSLHLKPNLVLLDSVEESNALGKEQFWIMHFYSFGFLLNDKKTIVNK